MTIENSVGRMLSWPVYAPSGPALRLRAVAATVTVLPGAVAGTF